MFMRLSSVSLSWVVSLNLKAVIRSSKSNRMFVTCLQTWSCKHYFPLSFVSQLKGCDHWSGLPNRIECLAPVFKLVLVNIIFPFHLCFNFKGVIRYSKSNRTFVTCHQTCSCKLYFPLFFILKRDICPEWSQKNDHRPLYASHLEINECSWENKENWEKVQLQKPSWRRGSLSIHKRRFAGWQ